MQEDKEEGASDADSDEEEWAEDEAVNGGLQEDDSSDDDALSTPDEVEADEDVQADTAANRLQRGADDASLTASRVYKFSLTDIRLQNIERRKRDLQLVFKLGVWLPGAAAAASATSTRAIVSQSNGAAASGLLVPLPMSAAPSISAYFTAGAPAATGDSGPDAASDENKNGKSKASCKLASA